MGRPLRTSLGGFVYHVLNRGNGRLAIFHKDLDYQAFLNVLAEAQEHVPGMRLLSYCLMPNHWHLVLWPTADGELSDFMHWLTLTHTQRWHAHYQNRGGGHLYQGRFKSFPIQDDEHFLTVCRYVERNAVRANLVAKAEHWCWGSLAQRRGVGAPTAPVLSDGPLPWPDHWRTLVNRPLTEAELQSVRHSVERGQPYGTDFWTQQTAGQLGLASTLRPRGRPKKGPDTFSQTLRPLAQAPSEFVAALRYARNAPNATDAVLQDAYRNLWRPQDVSPGGTIGALLREVRAGGPLTHLQKAKERLQQLISRVTDLSNPLSSADRAGAERVIRELREAIRMAGGR